VLARRAEWIKNACLAAALILPAVAAVHGIVLAALHRDSKKKNPSAGSSIGQIRTPKANSVLLVCLSLIRGR
jgi:hypothetical protein